MPEQEQKVDIGSIGSRFGTLDLKLTSQPDGKLYVDVFAYEPANVRKTGILTRPDTDQLKMLKALIFKVDGAIKDLQSSQYQKRQQLMNHLQSLTSEQLSGLGIDSAWLV